MLHLTSPDLETWTHRGTVDMPSPNLIDACVIMCPDGLWRLWYKDESRGSCTQVATSDDLFDWTYEREVIPGRASGGNPHEGPNVFELGGWFWMIVDEWHGQAVFRSDDATTWQRQGIILDAPGSDPMDRCFARHADVVPQDGLGRDLLLHPPAMGRSVKAAAEDRRGAPHRDPRRARLGRGRRAQGDAATSSRSRSPPP